MLRPIIVTLFALAGLSACQTAPLQPAAVLRHVEVSGANIAYIEQGSGIPVVFVHGSMSDPPGHRAELPLRGLRLALLRHRTMAR